MYGRPKTAGAARGRAVAAASAASTSRWMKKPAAAPGPGKAIAPKVYASPSGGSSASDGGESLGMGNNVYGMDGLGDTSYSAEYEMPAREATFADGTDDDSRYDLDR